MKKSIVTLAATVLTAMALTSCVAPRPPQIYCRMDSVCAKAGAEACSKNGGVEDGTCAAEEAFARPQAAAEETEWLNDSRDGEKYRTVKIGEQIWMAENLKIKTEGSICNENKQENCDKYGRLYNWPDAMQACPSGWHLPTDDEWAVLEKAVGGSFEEKSVLGMNIVSSSTAGTALKSKGGWSHSKGLFSNEMIIFGNGTDDYGWSALPGGHFTVPPTDYVPGYGAVQIGNPEFTSPGSFGSWWSATEHPNDGRKIYANSRTISSSDGKVHWNAILINGYKGSGLSVRCVQDVVSTTGENQ